MQLRTWSHKEREERVPGQRRTVGVVIDSLVQSGYTRILFESIVRTAQEQSIDLVAFIGGKLPSPLYDIVSRKNVDALILSSASLMHQVGSEGLAAFAARFDVPIVSVGFALPGAASIVPDGVPGVTALVTHLLTEHGKRDVACIRGPGADGRERFETFCRTLEEFGVPLREELVVDGDYNEQSGADAIRTLCDVRKVKFNAVVAANDYMALGAIAALEERDLAVPRDVAVVGFDDIEDARHATVPLTTVRQPIRELGKRAVLSVVEQLTGHTEPEPVSVLCPPIKRRSCGCVVESPFTRRPASASKQFADVESALLGRRDLVLADLSRTAQGELGMVAYEWEQTLFNAIQEELRTPGVGKPFLTANEELARRVFRAGGDVSTWQRVLATLRHHVLECVGTNMALRSAAENAFYDSLLLTTSVVGREEAQSRKHLERLVETAVKTGNRLMTSIEPELLGRTLAEHLGSLGIPSFYIATYEDDSRKRVRLLVGYDADLLVERSEDIVYDAEEIVPRGLLPRTRETAFTVTPLVHEGKALGFAVFEYRPKSGPLIHILGEQIAAALTAVALRSEK
jgi:DNA-binding LacI/PurR family transcriptional regulator